MTRSLPQRILLLVATVALTAGTFQADRVAELIAIHVEAIGGRERIAALKSLRATGHVEVGGAQLRFSMLAARPNRVRLETSAHGRTLLQGFDGMEPAWELDTGIQPQRSRVMAERDAKTFVADAEFDDPLIGGAARGYVFDYSGETELKGRRCFRVLVTRNLTETFSLLIDSRTYFLLRRIEHRTTVSGRKVEVITDFSDFRPVEGVLLAHQVAVRIEGRVSQQTRIERIEANVVLAEDAFSCPRS